MRLHGPAPECGIDDERGDGVNVAVSDAQSEIGADSTTRERITRDAIERNAILTRRRASDHVTSEFVSTASHEMRTPLAIIREFVSLVHDGVTGSVTPDQKTCLETALRNCDRLASLLDSLSDLARIEAGEIRLSRSNCALSTQLERWVADFSPKLAAGNKTLSLEIVDGPLPSIVCDSDKIQQVVVNLIGNAHQFTDEGGRITVRARHIEGAAVVEVEDTGIGIAPEDQGRVFDAFARIGRRGGSGAKGSGLGLTIARRIVELHGGSISVTSTVGMGSTFAFTIPVSHDLTGEVLGVVVHSPPPG